jgi:hypothetical protein
MNWMEQRRRKAHWRLMLRVAGAGLSAVLFFSLTGFLLPEEHTARRQAFVPTSPETVWRVLTDLDGLPHWRSDIRFLERLPDRGGRPAWREDGVHGSHIFVLAESQPHSRLVVQSTSEAAIRGTIRVFDLVAAASGTLVTVTDRRLLPSPIERVLVRLPLGLTGAGALLRDLGARLGEAPQMISALAD